MRVPFAAFFLVALLSSLAENGAALQVARPLTAASSDAEGADTAAGSAASGPGDAVTFKNVGATDGGRETHTICRVRGAGQEAGVGDVAVVLDSNTNERSLVFGLSANSTGGETAIACDGSLADSELTTCLSFGEKAAVDSVTDCPACPCHGVVGPFPSRFAYMTEMARSVTTACTRPWTWKESTYDVLIIGMGGGALATHIGKDCGSKTRVEGIEYDGRVIDVSERYFGVQPSDSMAVERADGLDAVQERVGNSRSYDAILIDCFSKGGETPDRCRNQEFVSGLHKLLREGGFVAHHLWHQDKGNAQVASEFKATVALYQSQFGKTTVVPLSTRVNDVVYAAASDDGLMPAAAGLHAAAKDTWNWEAGGIEPVGADGSSTN